MLALEMILQKGHGFIHVQSKIFVIAKAKRDLRLVAYEFKSMPLQLDMLFEIFKIMDRDTSTIHTFDVCSQVLLILV